MLIECIWDTACGDDRQGAPRQYVKIVLVARCPAVTMQATLLTLLVLVSTHQSTTQPVPVDDTRSFVAAATNQSTTALLVQGGWVCQAPSPRSQPHGPGTITLGPGRFYATLDDSKANNETVYRTNNLAINAGAQCMILPCLETTPDCIYHTATEENTDDIIDFGNVPAVLTMAANTTLRFENITVKGVASRYLPGLRTNITLVNLGLGLWPSVILEPNATVHAFLLSTCFHFALSTCTVYLRPPASTWTGGVYSITGVLRRKQLQWSTATGRCRLFQFAFWSRRGIR